MTIHGYKLRHNVEVHQFMNEIKAQIPQKRSFRAVYQYTLIFGAQMDDKQTFIVLHYVTISGKHNQCCIVKLWEDQTMCLQYKHSIFIQIFVTIEHSRFTQLQTGHAFCRLLYREEVTLGQLKICRIPLIYCLKQHCVSLGDRTYIF